MEPSSSPVSSPIQKATDYIVENPKCILVTLILLVATCIFLFIKFKFIDKQQKDEEEPDLEFITNKKPQLKSKKKEDKKKDNLDNKIDTTQARDPIVSQLVNDINQNA